jgi:hypothetical protein
MRKEDIKSFTGSWASWNTSWPNWAGSNTTIQLPVEFRLELNDGVSKSDCLIGQDKRGRSEIGGHAGDDIFLDWTKDSPIGERYWWDGEKWGAAGKGKWTGESVGCSSGPETIATFKDAPGFYRASYPNSLFMGAANNRSGYFDFRTYVMDRASERILLQILWSMRIDIPDPKKPHASGGNWWSFDKLAAPPE